MAAAIWITPAGTLGTIPELEYYEYSFDAYNPTGSSLTYSLIAGNLPQGLTLSSTGILSGLPINGDSTGIPPNGQRVTTSTFTVRITTNTNTVSDRTFSLTISGLVAPIISPDSGTLGTYIDGSYVDVQISATELNPLLTAKFSASGGQLPPGVSIDENGLITGYITPVPYKDGDNSGLDVSPYGVFGFDSSGKTNLSKNYQFAVTANNSVNSASNEYSIYVYSRTNFTADNFSTNANVSITADDVSIITADQSSLYSPVIYTQEGLIGSVGQNKKFAYQFDAIDFNGDDLSFALIGSLPPGLVLNSSGWIIGTVPYGTLGSQTYTFSVYAYKTNDPIYTSEIKSFSLKVIGQLNDTVNWISDSNLGSIYNGSISELAISAQTASGKLLRFRLADGSYGALPVGLKLEDDGTISGRPSFNMLGSSETYTFSVVVFDNGNYVYDTKEFSIEVLSRDNKPYENLHIQLLPNRSQRTVYSNIIDNSDIVPVDYLYRPQDPWFGKNIKRRVLFLTGLNPLEASGYINAMTLNHYWKTLNFGEIKTAQALDDTFNVKYEVVYIELIDQQVNSQGIGPNLTITWPNNTVGISSVYPNSFPNMVQRLTSGVGFQDRSTLPTWMTSRQIDGTVLGFTRGLILCYVTPGKGLEVAYRVRQVADQFNLLDFTVDRYEWDSILSDNWIKGNANGTGTISTTTTSANVTGTGTNFINQVTANTVIYSDTGVLVGTVGNVVSSNLLTLSANSLTTLTSNSFTYSQTFIVNNYSNATGTITSLTNSNVITGTVANITCTGNISGNVNSKLIVGRGTLFATELYYGANIYVSGNTIGTVALVISNTSAKLSEDVPSNIANVSFTASKISTRFTEELHVGDKILANGTVLGTVDFISNNTSLTLTSNANIAVNTASYSHTTRDPYTTPGQGDKYLKFPQIGVLS